MKLTSNFNLNEFRSKDGAPFPPEVIQNLTVLAYQLQALRDRIKKPITITSGFRSKEHNAKVGGALESLHTVGMAADIQVNGMTAKQLYDVIDKLIADGAMKEGGLGLYKSWVHYDHRGTRVRWKK